jgi:hypothetical protein
MNGSLANGSAAPYHPDTAQPLEPTGCTFATENWCFTPVQLLPAGTGKWRPHVSPAEGIDMRLVALHIATDKCYSAINPVLNRAA